MRSKHYPACPLGRSASPSSRFARLSRSIAVALIASLGTAASAAHAADADRFAVISDIHLQPTQDAAVASQLAVAPADDWPADLRTSASAAFPDYGEDSNPALMQSALSAFADATRAADIGFAIYAGDALAHRFKDRAAALLNVAPDSDLVEAYAAATTGYVIDSIANAAPGVPLLAALGNEDAACGDYGSAPGSTYLRSVAAAVRRAAGSGQLGDSFETTFQRGGYYSARHPVLSDVRILVLNGTLLSAKYRESCRNADTTPGRTMLRWFEGELIAARHRGDQVWVVSHIPLGIDPFAASAFTDVCTSSLSASFLARPFAERTVELWQHYADVIAVTINAHTHMDSFRLIAAQPEGEGSGGDAAAKLVPAISPIYGNNPAFQIFDYDRLSKRTTDYVTHSLDLGAAGVAPARAVWDQTYRFRDSYGRLFGAAAVREIADDLQIDPDGPIAAAFDRHYRSDHDRPPTTLRRLLPCALVNVEMEPFQACVCESAADVDLVTGNADR